MKILFKLFVIILIAHGSSADFVPDNLSIVSKASETVTSASGNLQSLAKATSNLSAVTLLQALHITKDGILNLNTLIQTLNLPGIVDVKKILNSLNIHVSKHGKVNLRHVFQNINPAHMNVSDVLSLFNVTTSNGILDFSSLIKNIASHGSFSDFVSSLTVQKTEDGLLDFTGLALKYCGNVKQYNVTTEDGYILDVYRIPGDGKVVLLSHGILSSSDDFIIRGKTSLIYLLAQAGFDVWVINYRGNRYSRRHIELDPDTDKRFFNYSMHEMAYYDLSAVIDFALKTTGKKQLSLIGHSEGTSTGFILTSTKPEYNDVIERFIALSPVADLSDSGVALTTLIRVGPAANEILLAFGVEELLRYNSLSRKLFEFVCSQGIVGYNFCYKVLIAPLSGYDPNEVDPEFFRTIVQHYPIGTSRKNAIHYSQVGINDRFAQYDYGSKNQEYYGAEIPPIYDLSKVTCKVSMYMSRNDKVVGLKASERVRQQLPNVVGYHIVDYAQFTHTGFLYAKNAYTSVYEPTISELKADN